MACGAEDGGEGSGFGGGVAQEVDVNVARAAVYIVDAASAGGFKASREELEIRRDA
jgi:hypothetical protein